MDLDALLITVTKLKTQVDEIRKRLGLDEPQETSLHGVQSSGAGHPIAEAPAAEPEEEEEVEEHDPETGHTQRTRRKRSR